MLRDFFRRLAPTPPASPPSRPNTTSAPVAPTLLDPPARTTTLPDREVGDVNAWLALEVNHRIAAVRETLARQDREGDAPAFLDGLAAGFDAVVRQPPLAAQRALSVSRDPRASASQLVSLVETDPGLSQGLLRYANSAFYAGAGGRVVSLMNAVNRVGTSGVHNVVLRTMVDGLLCRPGGHFQSWVDMTWEHMVRVAPIARDLSKPFGVSPDEAYLLGLLHDVGKLVIFDRLGELRRQLRREVRLPPAMTSLLLQFLHETLGGLAALQWGLGAQVAHAIATHRRSPVPEMLDSRCELIYVAERLDLWRIRPEAVEESAPLADWWRDGALNAPLEPVERLVANLPEAAATGAGD
ncbi:MAG: HDOD domain-containing protein [Gemmatimonadetes bacterium]|nr:HDOD domain-containing protein [Gemmatimonadota bacterium]